MNLDEPRDEYDFRRGARGRHVGMTGARENMRELDPDLAALYPDSASVNQALRRLSQPSKGTKTRAAKGR
jgi:hypothetical protein